MELQKRIIISRLLGSDKALTAFLFDPDTSLRLRADPDMLAFDSWELRPEQQILVRAALDIWDAKGNVFFWELLKGLDGIHLTRLIHSLESWRDLKSECNQTNSITANLKYD